MDRQVLTFKQNYVHQEEEPNVEEINEVFTSAKKDLEYLDENITTTASNFNSLLSSTRLKLNEIKQLLIAERERQQDINILCNKYSDFASVLNLNKDDFAGSLEFKDGILQSRVTSTSSIDYEVEAVDGNGFKGNRYVYLNEEFLNATVDSSLLSYINDKNLATNFEYSRLTTIGEGEYPIEFNKDSIEAECSVLIQAEDLFNHVKLSSNRDDLILKEVYTSLDGLSYKLDKEYNIAINDRGEIYNNCEYIYGSGIISIEPSKFVKLILKSNGYSDDQLAHTKTFYSDNVAESHIKKIEKINDAKRHVISISDITLLKNKYAKGMVTSRELITSPIKCIGLYCNAYINNDYSLDKNISYYLILNGNEYQVNPINSHVNGKKIARTSSQTYQSDHVIYLNEDIKSAKLKIVINTNNSDITPYISDIKILIGGEE